MKQENVIIICRCEDLTYDDIVKAVRDGYTTLEEIKRHLRCGMGPCQGRTCVRLIIGIIANETGKPISQIERPTVRPPLRPIPVGVLTGVKHGVKE